MNTLSAVCIERIVCSRLCIAACRRDSPHASSGQSRRSNSAEAMALELSTALRGLMRNEAPGTMPAAHPGDESFQSYVDAEESGAEDSYGDSMMFQSPTAMEMLAPEDAMDEQAYADEMDAIMNEGEMEEYAYELPPPEAMPEGMEEDMEGFEREEMMGELVFAMDEHDGVQGQILGEDEADAAMGMEMELELGEDELMSQDELQSEDEQAIDEMQMEDEFDQQQGHDEPDEFSASESASSDSEPEEESDEATPDPEEEGDMEATGGLENHAMEFEDYMPLDIPDIPDDYVDVSELDVPLGGAVHPDEMYGRGGRAPNVFHGHSQRRLQRHGAVRRAHAMAHATQPADQGGEIAPTESHPMLMRHIQRRSATEQNTHHATAAISTAAISNLRMRHRLPTDARNNAILADLPGSRDERALAAIEDLLNSGQLPSLGNERGADVHIFDGEGEPLIARLREGGRLELRSGNWGTAGPNGVRLPGGNDRLQCEANLLWGRLTVAQALTTVPAVRSAGIDTAVAFPYRFLHHPTACLSGTRVILLFVLHHQLLVPCVARC